MKTNIRTEGVEWLVGRKKDTSLTSWRVRRGMVVKIASQKTCY